MDDIKVILARIDERTKNIESQLKHFVRREEFSPIKKLCYGFIGAVLLGALTVLGDIILKSRP